MHTEKVKKKNTAWYQSDEERIQKDIKTSKNKDGRERRRERKWKREIGKEGKKEKSTKYWGCVREEKAKKMGHQWKLFGRTETWI